MTNKPAKYSLGVLVSGRGSNLQAIINATRNNIIPDTSVDIVISDKRDAYALKRAREAGIDNLFINPEDFPSREKYDEKIANILQSYNIDLLILAGYLKIITKPLLNCYNNRILNIHPGLLPDFGGVKMYGIKVHEAVIKKGEKYSGCTVHIVTEEVDKGPVLDRLIVEVEKDDTPSSLGKRILKCEHELYPKVIGKYLKTLYEE